MRPSCLLPLLAVCLQIARADSLPPNLVGDGLPPLDPQIVERLHDYTQFRSARFCDWHPGKREILISTHITGVVREYGYVFERDCVWRPSHDARLAGLYGRV